ncbi:MAG: hypothetical protein LH631_08150 [Alkalinema sp. CAN_BIN05]|nr:hypothetical protein [Alkalinema sp. CAN_BIN05]
MKRFLNLRSFAKASFRSIQFSIVAIIMMLGLNLGTMKLAKAAPTSVVTPLPVAIFGLGRQAEGKIHQAVGEAQGATSRVNDQTKGFAKQAKGKAESDVGRIESSTKSAKSKTRDAVSDAADSASDTANAAVDKVKDLMGK